MINYGHISEIQLIFFVLKKNCNVLCNEQTGHVMLV